VTLSTTEAEYIAAASCACQCVWMRRVLEKLGHKEEKSTLVQCDNSSTIKLSKNPVFHGRSKHIGHKEEKSTLVQCDNSSTIKLS
jgi:hypothetical protein